MEQTDNYNYCHIVERTDVGCKRPANEDHMGHFDTVNGRVAVVCDGMGGHVGGATASHIAVDAIHAFLDSAFIESPQEAIGRAIDAANAAILRQAAAQPELAGMGSTCVLLLIRNGLVYRGHVGDSRIYLIRNRTIKQLTRDDSYVQMLVDMGKLSPEKAEHHPRKNEITNALGLPDMKPATVAEDAIAPEAGDCFLLCSDGLTGMVSERDIERIVSRQQELTSQQRADQLVERAKENGGLDNITVQLVEFSLTPGEQDTPRQGTSSSKGKIIAAIVLACCLVAGAGFYFLKGGKGDDVAAEQKQENKEEQTRQEQTVKPRTHEDCVLTDVEFKKNMEILRIEYGEAETAFVRGEGRLRTLARALSPDSLKCDKQVQVDNGKILVFKDKFVGDTLRFSLADSTTVYDIKVPVKGGSKAAKSSEAPGAPSGKKGSGGTPEVVPDGGKSIKEIFRDSNDKEVEDKSQTPKGEGEKPAGKDGNKGGEAPAEKPAATPAGQPSEKPATSTIPTQQV